MAGVLFCGRSSDALLCSQQVHVETDIAGYRPPGLAPAGDLPVTDSLTYLLEVIFKTCFAPLPCFLSL
jgi:hypothetical protein